MNLHTMLAVRAAAGNPVRVGLVGAGKFGTMFLAQARLTTGLHLMGIADLNPDRARSNCRAAGWSEERIGAGSFDEARRSGATHICDNAEDLIGAAGLEVLIEASGDPAAGIRHCLQGIEEGRHLVMVNVEADVVAGPLLARRARAAGVVYSLAWGDQPALICDHVDWARTCGFEVTCAGKGTRYHPDFHRSTPETVWDNFHFGRETAERGGMNPKMFNSFIDGTKSAIEMSAVCNTTGLRPQPGGLGFPPASCWELAEVCKPKSAGGTLQCAGTTEVVSSLHRDMRPVENDLMVGTYVVVKADNDYVRHCFEEYRMLPDSTCDYAALFRPVHMIGLELGVSVGLGGPARRAHRCAHRVSLRCSRHCEEGSQGRRDSGRRRGLLRLGPTDVGAEVLGDGRPAAGPGSQCPPQARRQRRPAVALGGRPLRRRGCSAEGAARNGGGFRERGRGRPRLK